MFVITNSYIFLFKEKETQMDISTSKS